MGRHETPLSPPVNADGRLGVQIRQLRKASGLTLRQVGDMVGWHFAFLSNVERSIALPGEVLIVELDVLFNANGELLSLYEEVLAARRRRDYERTLIERKGQLPLLREVRGTPTLPTIHTSLPLPGDASNYLGEVTAPNGILLHCGTSFTKTWRIANVGTVEWRDRYMLRVGPNAASTLVQSERAVLIPLTPPGAAVDIAVKCRAQWIESTSIAHFKMAFADGRLCFPDRYSHGVDLLVTSTVNETCTCVSCQAVGPLEPKHRRVEPTSSTGLS